MVIIPSTLSGCDVYSNTAIPTNVRLPNTTTVLRFPGPSLVNPLTPSRFATWTADLPNPIKLDLANNEFTALSSAATFAAFGQQLGPLSHGRITAVHRNALAGLPALRDLTLAGNGALVGLPELWLGGLSALTTLDLSGCALANVTNGTLAGATSLTSVTLNNNPILSMDSHPFPPEMSVDEISMLNTTLICIPSRDDTSTRAVCVACSPTRNRFTLFVEDAGRARCELPAEVSELINATQFLPPHVGADARDYLSFGARTKWALGRTYHVMPVECVFSLLLATSDVVVNSVLFVCMSDRVSYRASDSVDSLLLVMSDVIVNSTPCCTPILPLSE